MVGLVMVMVSELLSWLLWIIDSWGDPSMEQLHSWLSNHWQSSMAEQLTTSVSNH